MSGLKRKFPQDFLRFRSIRGGKNCAPRFPAANRGISRESIVSPAKHGAFGAAVTVLP
ncbi:MAG: hypothetical protein ACI3V4_13230 [Faecousia sp.]